MLRTWQRNLVCAIAGADWCPRELHISGIGFKRSLEAVARALPVPQPEAAVALAVTRTPGQARATGTAMPLPCVSECWEPLGVPTLPSLTYVC